MKIIFLAAGSGSRLGNLTKKIPKALVKINETSMIEQQINLFKKNGIGDIYIIRGYKKEKFCIPGIKFIDDDNYSNHDQLGSLITATKQISGEVLILFADIIFDQKIFNQIMNGNQNIGIAIDKNWEIRYEEQDKKQFPALAEFKDKDIISISEKKINTKNKQMGEFLGIIKLSAEGSKIFTQTIENIKKHKGKFHDSSNVKVAKLTDIIAEIIKSGCSVEPILIDGKWIEVDTVEDLQEAKIMF